MKRLPAIVIIVVVLLILGATPVAAIGPQENGNFGGNAGQGWYYVDTPDGGWWYKTGYWWDVHKINWSTALLVIPSDQAGYHSSLKSPFIQSVYGPSTLELPVP